MILSDWKCGNCKFFDPLGAIGHMPDDPKTIVTKGSCRRYAPRAYCAGGALPVQWPPVYDVDFCGDFSPSPTKGELSDD